MSPEPTPVLFGDGVSWDPVGFFRDTAIGDGWMSPDGSFIINDADTYWGDVLDRARNQYGDPGIRFNTGDADQPRFLVYSDGTPLPPTVTYRDPSGSMFRLNSDGSSSMVGPGGAVAPAQFPAGYTQIDGQYAPLNAQGQQIAPQATTPFQNGRPYYVDNPGQPRQYFDGTGAPVSQAEYTRLISPDPPQDPGDAPMSGATRDAIANMQEELKQRYSELNSAEQALSEAVLTAAATTDAGREKLAEIQQNIIDAVDDPQYDLDTPAGETAYLKFLRDQVAEISELVASGALASKDAAEITQALAALYTAGSPGTEASEPGAASPGDATAQPGAAPVDAAVAPGEPLPLEDYGLGEELAMPDTSLSDLGLGTGMGTDPLAGLTSAIPSMLSALPGMMGSATGSNPFTGLSGLSGLAEPLAGLASGLAEQAEDEPELEEEEPADEDAVDDGEDGETDVELSTGPPAEGEPPVESEPQPGDVEDPAAAPVAEVSEDPLPPPTDVVLPDGSTVTTPSPQAAQAMNLHVDGTPLTEAYRTQQVELPPPGTPVVAPISPSALMAGDVGVFKDRLVAALGQDRVFIDGQVQPISVLGSSPDFLGWMRPTTAALTDPAATAAPVAGQPALPVPVGAS